MENVATDADRALLTPGAGAGASAAAAGSPESTGRSRDRARGGRDVEVLGEGFHAELGGLHAEVAALADCRASAATMPPARRCT